MLNILTLNYNGRNKLETLYPTLLNSLNGIEYKWFIRDNGSNDNSIGLEDVWKNDNVVWHKIKNNVAGFATGCNYLFDQAKPKDNDLILLLNNDIAFRDEHSIKKMISLIENDDDIGVVGAKLNYSGTNKLQHAGVVIDKTRGNLPNHYRARETEDDAARKNREFNSITAACLLTRASLYGDHKLTETYFFCFEDIDYCFRLKYNLNKKIVYCGQTNIDHDESYTLKKNNFNKLFLKHNVETFRNKWRDKCIDDNQFYLADKNYNLYKKQ